ncbi:MAG: YARHG domain-containing protein [Nitrososphaeraceae archaeon]
MNRIITILILIGILGCQKTKRNDNLYSAEQFEGKSLKELRIVRNEIFAKHRYIFKSNDLTDYFNQFNWYEPKLKKVDSLLTENEKKNIQLIVSLEKELKRCIIPTNKKLIESYREIKNNSTRKRTKEFSETLLKTIQQFENKKADTTILTIKNIDGKNGLDTLFTNISYYNGHVAVKSYWKKNGKILWNEKLDNPYLWISENEEYQYDSRNPWVTFTIGVYHAVPELQPIEYYTAINYKTAIEMAKSWFGNTKGFNEIEYLTYLKNYKGQILLSGDPEIAYELLIWYEPLQTFIRFYAS